MRLGNPEKWMFRAGNRGNHGKNHGKIWTIIGQLLKNRGKSLN
jgi:hypothetical protein